MKDSTTEGRGAGFTDLPASEWLRKVAPYLCDVRLQGSITRNSRIFSTTVVGYSFTPLECNIRLT